MKTSACPRLAVASFLLALLTVGCKKPTPRALFAIDPRQLRAQLSAAEAALARAQAMAANAELDRVAVRIALDDGSVSPLPGHLDFLDLRIDETAGGAIEQR